MEGLGIRFDWVKLQIFHKNNLRITNVSYQHSNIQLIDKYYLNTFNKNIILYLAKILIFNTMYIHKIKKVASLVSLISAILILSGCAAMFLPENQKVIVKSNNANNEIYLDNELIGKGKSFSTKINKQDAQGQIVISRKGYKNINDVILKSRRQIAFYPLLILDLPFGYLGFGVDLISPNCQAYPKEITINASEEYLLPVRKESDKYLNISNIKLDINDKEKDLVDIQVGMVFDMNNLQKSIQDSEKAYYENWFYME